MRIVVLWGLAGLIGAGSQAWADSCDSAIKNCCQGLEYWTGFDRSSGERLEVAGNTVNPMSGFVAYWNSYGGLDEGRLARQATSIGLFMLAFGLLVLLFGATARRRQAPGVVLVSALVAVPALVWWFVPGLLARSEAASGAAAYINTSLRPLCYEASNQTDLTIGGCSPTVWGNLFESEAGPRQVLATCNSMPEEAEQLLSGPKSDPCVATCAESVAPLKVNNAGKASEVSGYQALSARLWMIKEMMSACQDVMSAWRAEKGPAAVDWQTCADGLAEKSFRREVKPDLMLQHGWFGAVLSILLAGLILPLVRRR